MRDIEFQIGANSETARWVNGQHERMQKGTRQRLDIALEMGRVLAVVQSKSSSGFVAWLNGNIKFSQLTAYNYISLHNRLAREEAERDKRIEAVKNAALKREEERKKKEAERESLKAETAALLGFLSASAEAGRKRAEFKEKIRLSADGMKDPFQDALLDYLDGLEGDSRRIEACHNIIKICKRAAGGLQGAKA